MENTTPSLSDEDVWSMIRLANEWARANGLTPFEPDPVTCDAHTPD